MTIQWRIAPMLPSLPTRGRSVDLVCRGLTFCPSYGKRFRVVLQYAAPGVLAYPNFVCADCLMELALVTEEEIHG